MRNAKVLVALLLVAVSLQYTSATWTFNIPGLDNDNNFEGQGDQNFAGGRRISRPRNFIGTLQRIFPGWFPNPNSKNMPPIGTFPEGLKEGFYNSTCPNAEKIIRDTVQAHFNKDPTLTAGILRLFFHDCFVRGCDASLLLEKTFSNEQTEKSALANSFTLHGEEVIDAAKSALEAACPGIISCADILSYVTRDVVVMSGFQFFPMVAGRRDGTISVQAEVGMLPDPLSPVNVMTELFNKRGFSQDELVVLLGAHSVGGAHCFTFINRLYEKTDPALNSNMAQQLKNKCPMQQQGADVTKDAKVDFDPATPNKLDTSYYKGVLNGQGLLSSDHVLVTDPKTKAKVSQLAADPERWKREFAQALMKLSKLDVLVGRQGQVRQQCRAVNPAGRGF